MKLLFATSIVPTTSVGSGYEIANQAILDGLRRAGIDVTVVGFAWPGRPLADPQNTIALGEIDVRTDTAPLPLRLKWLARAVSAGATFSSSKLMEVSSERLRETIRSRGPFDGVVLNSVQFAGAFETVFADWPSVYVAHNVEHVSALENAAALTGYKAALFRREARLLESLEQRLCQRARFVFTLSPEDLETLHLDAGRAACLPMVTRRDGVAPAPRQPLFDAAIIGTWTWQPNLIGLQWFLDQVVPNLPEDFSVHIAGQMPPGIGSPHPGVRFVGRVPDATAFLREGRMVPLFSRAGTGVQLKTIETFELGLPAVATSSSLRGIDARPANCAVADDPRAFAEAMVTAAREGASDLDGRDFHTRQRAALDVALERGLDMLAGTRTRIAA
ncbi:MAG: glycosyltransferase family 4 protein [Mesorhizobium sp.]|nr:glycosyltransferase family 4 protein [Mesorhizobium sp.]